VHFRLQNGEVRYAPIHNSRAECEMQRPGQGPGIWRENFLNAAAFANVVDEWEQTHFVETTVDRTQVFNSPPRVPGDFTVHDSNDGNTPVPLPNHLSLVYLLRAHPVSNQFRGRRGEERERGRGC
jgi:hypothetical protein